MVSINIYNSNRVRLYKNQQLVIKKVLPNYRYSSEWIKECTVFQFLKKHPHPNLMKMTKFIYQKDIKDIIGVITPYYQDTLSTFNCNALSFLDKILLFKQLVKAVHHLHQYDIVHTDLKPDNIFLNHVNDICIGDYDHVILYAKRTESHDCSILQTITYRSPEICGFQEFNSNTEIDLFKIDIWSLGVIGFNLFTNSELIPSDISNNQTLCNYMSILHTMKVIDKSLNQSIDHYGLKKLLQGMLRFNPKYRYNAHSILKYLDSFMENDDCQIICNLRFKTNPPILKKKYKLTKHYHEIMNWCLISNKIDKYQRIEKIPDHILALSIEYTWIYHQDQRFKSYQSEIFDLCLSKAEKIYDYNCYYDNINFRFQSYFITYYDSLSKDNHDLSYYFNQKILIKFHSS